MNVEYIDSLLAALVEAKATIQKWTEYKVQVEEALKTALEIPDQDELYKQLRDKSSGSTTQKYTGSKAILETKFSVELSFEQEKIISLLQEHPDLVGVIAKVKYEPASAKTIFNLLKSGNPTAQQLEGALKIAKRGPYLSVKTTEVA